MYALLLSALVGQCPGGCCSGGYCAPPSFAVRAPVYCPCVLGGPCNCGPSCQCVGCPVHTGALSYYSLEEGTRVAQRSGLRVVCVVGGAPVPAWVGAEPYILCRAKALAQKRGAGILVGREGGRRLSDWRWYPTDSGQAASQ